MAEASKTSEMTGVQKAAILLIALGPEKSSEIFKHLKEDEIEELTLSCFSIRFELFNKFGSVFFAHLVD